jgi:hypothetical protein
MPGVIPGCDLQLQYPNCFVLMNNVVVDDDPLEVLRTECNVFRLGNQITRKSGYDIQFF